jgi:hypothetical protein
MQPAKVQVHGTLLLHVHFCCVDILIRNKWYANCIVYRQSPIISLWNVDRGTIAAAWLVVNVLLLADLIPALCTCSARPTSSDRAIATSLVVCLHRVCLNRAFLNTVWMELYFERVV